MDLWLLHRLPIKVWCIDSKPRENTVINYEDIMNISRLQSDKLIVGTNDVSYSAPDNSPTGTAVLNGPVYVGKTGASPGYVGSFKCNIKFCVSKLP